MIVTATELINSGVANISSEIDEAKIENAISNAEMFVVKDRLGDALYLGFLNGTADDVLLDGGEYQGRYIVGLKRAIFNLAVAFLLRTDVAATIFGSVRKKDEYSENQTFETIDDYGRFYFTLGETYLKELCEVLNAPQKPYYNNYFFGF